VRFRVGDSGNIYAVDNTGTHEIAVAR